ncbi:MAG: 23S rRNA (adenine(2503)-C(2))-methyltransferase RlmN [bacterium]
MNGQDSDLRDLSPAELALLMEKLGHRPFRSDQVMEWLYKHGVNSVREMTNIPATLKRSLQEFRLAFPREKDRRTSEDGTVKLAYELYDGEVIEAVRIPEKGHSTLCISSQAGCRMGCRFCRTGRTGFRRQLAPSEIVGQLMAAREEGLTTDNLVIMGMGEPLDNLESVSAALQLLCNQKAMGFSPSRITLSTIGLVNKLGKLAEIGIPFNLAVSLHSAVPKTRSWLVPAASSPDRLKSALRRYPLADRSRLTLEVVLIDGVNDSREEARALVRWCAGLRAKVNIIPFNPFAESEFKVPSREAVLSYQSVLRDKALPAYIRSSRGSDILAACGQLAVSP